LVAVSVLVTANLDRLACKNFCQVLSTHSLTHSLDLLYCSERHVKLSPQLTEIDKYQDAILFQLLRLCRKLLAVLRSKNVASTTYRNRSKSVYSIS